MLSARLHQRVPGPCRRTPQIPQVVQRPAQIPTLGRAVPRQRPPESQGFQQGWQGLTELTQFAMGLDQLAIEADRSGQLGAEGRPLVGKRPKHGYPLLSGRQCGASLKIAGREIGHNGDRVRAGWCVARRMAQPEGGRTLDWKDSDGSRACHR